MKILLVEDSARLRSLLISLLQDLATAIYECSDGVQATAAYAAQRPDWVVMDTALPRLDGFAATRQIKAAFPEACVCLLLQSGEPEWRAAACAAGASNWVIKDDLSELRRLRLVEGAGRELGTRKSTRPVESKPETD